MSTDDFEKRMQRQPLREIPAGWRREILQAARGAAPIRPQPDERPGWFPVFAARLSAALNPPWRAWAGLGAVWIVILGLQLAASDREPALVRTEARPSRAVAALQQQRLLLSELAGQSGSGDALRPRTEDPRPRSELPKQSLLV